MKKLFRFKHGLGDAVQFSIVLKHLKHYHPDWEIAVECPKGLHSVFNNSYPLVMPYTWRDTFGKPQEIKFSKPDYLLFNNKFPATKVTRCLKDEFGLDPIPDLYHYEIAPNEVAINKVKRYIDEEIKGEYGVIHYKGSKQSQEDKNLTDYEASLIVDMMLAEDVVPVILDWDTNSVLVKEYGDKIRNPNRCHPWLWDKEYTGDGATIYALIDNAVGFWGIDSGPAHIAGATKTPSYVFWWGTEPLHCFDLSENVTHIVHPNHNSLNSKYFKDNYNHSILPEGDDPIIDCLKMWLHNITTAFSVINLTDTYVQISCSNSSPWSTGMIKIEGI